MKNVQQILKKRAGMIGMVCLLAGLFTSCVKDNNTYVEEPVALISVINASPDSKPLDFFLDQNQANKQPIPYGYGLDYLRAYPRKRVATFYVAGTQQKVKTDTITLEANKYYSLFLTNLVSHPDALLLTDSLSNPAAGKATIRLVNLSPDAPALDLVVKGGAALASNKAYKGYSSFVPVQGNTNYTLEIHPAGTATVLYTLPAINLHSGSVYTVWVHGIAAATDQTKLTADVQLNAYYF